MSTLKQLFCWIRLLACTIKLFKHPMLSFSTAITPTLLFQAFAFWTFVLQAHEEQQSRVWERWERKAVEFLRTLHPVRLSWTAPLHILRGALDPLSPTHINLAKYRGYYCNVSVATPLVLLSDLSAGWMKAWLLGKRPCSFPLPVNLQGYFIHSLPCFIKYFSSMQLLENPILMHLTSSGSPWEQAG